LLDLSGPEYEKVPERPASLPQSPAAVVIEDGRIVSQETPAALEPPPAGSAEESQTRATAPLFWLRIAWLAGFVLAGAFFLKSHLRRRPDYRASLPLVHEEARQLLDRLAGSSRIELRRSDRILSPLT
jgi:hypothetical protein